MENSSDYIGKESFIICVEVYNGVRIVSSTNGDLQSRIVHAQKLN